MVDFDQCILLRPDSALAQAQKCFALVSNQIKAKLKAVQLFICNNAQVQPLSETIQKSQKVRLLERSVHISTDSEPAHTSRV